VTATIGIIIRFTVLNPPTLPHGALAPLLDIEAILDA
jgi:hypothetical protein